MGIKLQTLMAAEIEAAEIEEYLETDSNKVFEGSKFDIMLEELKGRPLSTAIDYWCMANRDCLNTSRRIDKAIEKLSLLFEKQKHS